LSGRQLARSSVVAGHTDADARVVPPSGGCQPRTA
jgi:hypothetical protein